MLTRVTALVTSGVSFASKVVARDDGSSLKFQIWDTAGQEEFHSLASLYVIKARACTSNPSR